MENRVLLILIGVLYASTGFSQDSTTIKSTDTVSFQTSTVTKDSVVIRKELQNLYRYYSKKTPGNYDINTNDTKQVNYFFKRDKPYSLNENLILGTYDSLIFANQRLIGYLFKNNYGIPFLLALYKVGIKEEIFKKGKNGKLKGVKWAISDFFEYTELQFVELELKAQIKGFLTFRQIVDLYIDSLTGSPNEGKFYKSYYLEQNLVENFCKRNNLNLTIKQPCFLKTRGCFAGGFTDYFNQREFVIREYLFKNLTQQEKKLSLDEQEEIINERRKTFRY